jgi:apolipoprotein N-acyltransferase
MVNARRISGKRDRLLTFTAFRKVADHVILSSGWARRGIAFFAGAIGALAMAPVDFFPAMLVPMTVAVWLIDGATASVRGGRRWLADARAAAGVGWWLGFGYFVAGLWWLGAAMLVEADEFAWALPLAVLGLPAVLGLFTGLGFALARILWSPGGARVLALAAGLGASEWLRGHVATGFPWNEFGMALGGNLVLAQAASLVGLYGLNVVAVALFATPALLNDDRVGRRSWLASGPFLALVALVALAGFGGWRLSTGHVGDVAGVRLRIMQPNLPQDQKFRPEFKDAILDRYASISDRATSPQITGVADVTHLIWPESAFPFILTRDGAAMNRLTSFLGPRAVLITGAAREENPPRGSGPRRVFYNSVQALDREHGLLATYDKVHLVPFGEYLPLGGVLEKMGLRQFVHIPGGFDAGLSRKPLRVPGLPALSPLVCYEAVFPGEVTPDGANTERPGALLNLSNDAWFGMTAGPYQHFSQSRLRAIEEGLPLARAANTGISAIVDPYGRVTGSLPLGVDGVLDGGLPEAIAATPFARRPLAGPLALLAMALIGALWGRRHGARATV